MFQPSTVVSASKNQRSISMNSMQPAPQVFHPLQQNASYQQQQQAQTHSYQPTTEVISHAFLYQPMPSQTIVTRKFAHHPSSGTTSISPTRVRISSTDSTAFSHNSNSSNSKIHQIGRSSAEQKSIYSIRRVEQTQHKQLTTAMPVQPFSQAGVPPSISAQPIMIKNAMIPAQKQDEISRQPAYKQEAVPQRIRVNNQTSIFQPPYQQVSRQNNYNQQANGIVNAQQCNSDNKRITISRNMNFTSTKQAATGTGTSTGTEQPSEGIKANQQPTVQQHPSIAALQPQQQTYFVQQPIQPVRQLIQSRVGRIIQTQTSQGNVPLAQTASKNIAYLPSPTKLNLSVSPNHLENQQGNKKINAHQFPENGGIRVVLFQDDITHDTQQVRNEQLKRATASSTSSRHRRDEVIIKTVDDESYGTEDREDMVRVELLEKENKQLQEMVIVLERRIIEILVSKEKEEEPNEGTEEDEQQLTEVQLVDHSSLEQSGDASNLSRQGSYGPRDELQINGDSKKVNIGGRNQRRHANELEAILNVRDAEIGSLRQQLYESKVEQNQGQLEIDRLKAEVEKLTVDIKAYLQDQIKYSTRAERTARLLVTSTDFEAIEKKVQELVDENVRLGQEAEKYKNEADQLRAMTSAGQMSTAGSAHKYVSVQPQFSFVTQQQQPPAITTYFQPALITPTTRSKTNSSKSFAIPSVSGSSNNSFVTQVVQPQQLSHEKNNVNRTFDSMNVQPQQYQSNQIQPFNMQKQQRFASVGKQPSYM